MIDLDRHTSDADPAALFIDGQQMSLVPNIRYGTAEYPERVARRLRAANIAALDWLLLQRVLRRLAILRRERALEVRQPGGARLRGGAAAAPLWCAGGAAGLGGHLLHLEPAMVRAVDLDQLAEVLTAMTRLLDASALRPGQPDSGLPHPATQRLSRHAHIMALAQLLGRQRRTKVRVVLPDQRNGVITHDIR